MMVLDHVGDQEAMVHAQLGQQPLARTTETSLQPRQGSLSCLRAQPPDLADLTVARPKVACVPLAGLPFLYSKRTAVTRSLVSLIEKRTFCRHFEHTSRGTTLVLIMFVRPLHGRLAAVTTWGVALARSRHGGTLLATAG